MKKARAGTDLDLKIAKITGWKCRARWAEVSNLKKAVKSGSKFKWKKSKCRNYGKLCREHLRQYSTDEYAARDLGNFLFDQGWNITSHRGKKRYNVILYYRNTAHVVEALHANFSMAMCLVALEASKYMKQISGKKK